MSRLQKPLLALFSVIIALVVGFVALRLTGTETILIPCEAAPGEWAELVTTLVKDYRLPCADFYWLPNPQDEFHNRIQLNNYGLQDTPLSLPKPGGVYRVLLVGDSFPQGWQVTLEQGFPWLVEQQLTQEAGRPVEVVNLSLDAYGTDRELLLYSILGWRFQPDLVLLVVYAGNDIQDNEINLEQRRYGYRQERPFFTLENGVLHLHDSPVYPPDRYDTAPAYQWLADMQAQQGAPPPENPPPVPRVVSDSPYTLEYPVELGLYLPEDEYWSNAWALTEALVLQFRDLAHAHGSQFAVVILPDRRAVHTEDWDATVQQHEFLRGANPLASILRLEDWLTAQNIPSLNLTWNLRAWLSQRPGERLYYGGDGHFNANGHAISAQRIVPWLRTEGLSP